MIAEKQQEVIDEIMDSFDFERVYKVMQHLNWEWVNVGVPEIYDIKKQARRLLKEAIKLKTSISTGGFCVTYDVDDEYDTIDLSFVVSNYYADIAP
jgi:hypothetical protein